MTFGRIQLACAATLAALLLPLPLAAVPDADHVQLSCIASRTNVNDYSVRKQVRLELDVAASDPARLDGIEESRLTVINPAGVAARVRPARVDIGERRFKAAHADLLFRLVEDSASRSGSNVPRGFFSAAGPYRVRVDMRWESYRGSFSFAEPVALKLSADGKPLRRFVLPPGAALEIATLPQRFGPVYYKRPDPTNFFLQLAGMDDALAGGDYRAPVESPRFFFQVRVGQVGQEKTQLLDPTAYISGAQHYLIRSEYADSPMRFPAAAFSAGQTLLIDFSRTETAAPGSVFFSSNKRFSEHVEVQERVIYALEVRDPAQPSRWHPLPSELETTLDQAAAVDAASASEAAR